MIDFKALIKRIGVNEGFRSKPYQCSEGVWTIGHGLTWLTEEESLHILTGRISQLHLKLLDDLDWYKPEKRIKRISEQDDDRDVIKQVADLKANGYVKISDRRNPEGSIVEQPKPKAKPKAKPKPKTKPKAKAKKK